MADWSTIWSDHKPIEPACDMEQRFQFLSCMQRQDFVHAHFTVIDLYRPLVSGAFHFTIIQLVFETASPEFELVYNMLFGLSIVQLVLTIF
mmetsp:Transcript_11758/g.14896  ORF Transcript_11758/g.14896 Transcript_11758/m.14896 type:complete len:91 (+) Transcript_11758:576-848(+)